MSRDSVQRIGRGVSVSDRVERMRDAIRHAVERDDEAEVLSRAGLTSLARPLTLRMTTKRNLGLT